MSDHDPAFYRRRELECRAQAEHSIDPGVRRTHLEFAERYARNYETSRTRPAAAAHID